MTIKDITATELITKVRQLAEASPDNQYQLRGTGVGCLYQSGNCTDGSRGCIVGQALRSFGWHDEKPNTGVAEVMRLLDIDSDDDRDNWLIHVQEQQDVGMKWEACIAWADEEHPEIAK